MVSGTTAAHPGHENVLSMTHAIMRGEAIVRSLIDKGESLNGKKLDKNWLQATDNASCKETPEYYLISFDNREAGKTLYILLSGACKYRRANGEGQLADLTFSPYPLQSCN